jgi:hypothetical protein
MALILPIDIVEYTENEAVKARSINKIQMDILKAETKIFNIVGHKFEAVNEIPQPVKLAAILYTEYYALLAVARKTQDSDKQSETLDEYSYTRGKSEIPEPDVEDLLLPYIVSSTEKKNRITLKVGRL